VLFEQAKIAPEQADELADKILRHPLISDGAGSKLRPFAKRSCCVFSLRRASSSSSSAPR
jgi:hypothetical protein